jgi:peroxiredoxin
MSFTLELGKPAPDFDLPGTDGKRHRLHDIHSCRLLVIAFTCNHCPFVIGSEERMVDFALMYAPKDVAFVAINSNETENHPTDDLPHMIQRARERNFPFPYLRDETQETALAYGALRTPHFFVFQKDADQVWRLHYTGRMDDNPRHPGQQTTHELTDAVDALLCGKEPPIAVTNPIGCNVKWKGKPQHWIPPEACDLV